MKLQSKITILFAGCISLVCSMAMLLALVQSSGFNEQISTKLNTQLIESKAAQASAWLTQRVDELRIISRSNEVLSMDMRQIQPFIDRLNDAFSENYGNEYGTFAVGGLDGLGYVTEQQTIDVSNRDYFKALCRDGTEYEISTPLVSKTDRSNIVLICYAVRDAAGAQIGFVNGAISLNRLTDLTDHIDFYGGTSFIADPDGNLYTNVGGQLAGDDLAQVLAHMPASGTTKSASTLTLGGEEKEVFFSHIPQTNDWYLCTVVARARLLQEGHSLIFSILLIWALLLILSWPLSFWVARYISRPIRRLSSAMQQVQAGDFTVAVPAAGQDETAQLASQFNRMVANTKQLLKAVEQEQSDRYRAQFQVLQNQIKPHFLYNTLDTLQWKALDYGADELAQLITALSGFFRVGLSAGQDFIPLKREFEHVGHYLTIQQYRYADILHYELSLPPTLGDALVSRLLLQPLVENAIYHGIKPKLAPGTIRIFTRAAADALELVVEDDGVGMDGAALAQLIAEIDSPEATQSVGLRNIQQRLKHIYGSGYGLHIISQPGAGTTVTVRLPLQKGGTNGDDCNL